MQIQLKQAEIIEALKGFITQQGINLRNKSVVVGFTAGRGGAGVSADITIEDVGGLPPLEADNEEVPAGKTPVLSVVKSDTPDVPAPAPVEEEKPAAPQADSNEVKAPSTSLFG